MNIEDAREENHESTVERCHGNTRKEKIHNFIHDDVKHFVLKVTHISSKV